MTICLGVTLKFSIKLVSDQFFFLFDQKETFNNNKTQKIKSKDLKANEIILK